MITWSGSKLADLGFYITLAHNKTRQQHTEELFDQEQLVGIKRFNGYLTKNGTLVTFLELFKSIQHLDFKTVVIFEDDCVASWFVSNRYSELEFNKRLFIQDLCTKIQQLNFDVFYLGVNLKAPVYYVDRLCARITDANTTHAIVFSKPFIEFCIEVFPLIRYSHSNDKFYRLCLTKTQLETLPKNVQLLVRQRSFNFYTSTILHFIQGATFSSNANKVTNCQESFKNSFQRYLSDQNPFLNELLAYSVR